MLSLSSTESWPESWLKVTVVLHRLEEERAMLSLSSTESWPESWLTVTVVLHRVVVSAAVQVEERARQQISVDDSLTSLQWLQEFSIPAANVPPPPHLFGPRPSGSDAPVSPLNGDLASIGMPLTPEKPTAAAYCPDKVDYKTEAHIKPPYSYATLICMAMQASNKSKITLSCIYKWITDNFCYYRHAKPTWKNSIRHSLSLNKYFIKVPRQKDEPGKGGFWTVDPQHAERLLSAHKKRRMPPVQINPALLNLPAQSRDPCSPTESQVGLYVNPESQMLLREFEQVTGGDQNWDPHLAEGTMLGSWPVDKGRGGRKRRQSSGHRLAPQAKAPRHSSYPLFPADEHKEIGLLTWDSDCDALLDSALNDGLTLGTEEESLVAAAFLECDRCDFLCMSNMNVHQVFDLGESLGPDPSAQIEVLL